MSVINFPFYGNAIYGATANLPTGVPDGTTAIVLDTYSLVVYNAGTATWGPVNLSGGTVVVTRVSAGAGTAALPSYTFTGDLDTGMYWVSANNIGFSTNGSLALNISSGAITPAIPLSSFRVTGTIGIGTPADTGFGIAVYPTTLTGTTPVGIESAPTLPVTATGVSIGVGASVSTAAASFTAASINQFYSQANSKGAGSTITRMINYRGDVQTTGTNNGFLVDNASFTGDWAINFTSTSPSLHTGSFGVGAAAVASALLACTSTTKGFLPPVMTETQRDAIGTPAEGLIIYNSTSHKLNVRVAAAWEAITSA